MGAHARIVKPRTAKQRAAIARMRHLSFDPRPAETAPRESWWLGLSRTELGDRARAEQVRMAGSKFGRLQGSPGGE